MQKELAMKNSLEILAPAGSMESAKAAIKSGADAIYLGYSAYSARQSAENFDNSSLRDVILEAHLCGVKVYVAMNTVVKAEELQDFINTLQLVWQTGVDAIIMQDALLGKRVHEQCPQIVLHLSTQAGVCDLDGAIFAKDCGFSRVILARETPLSEIEKIASFIETEVFIQGALCTCFSGQCYFSSFAGGNSGNRGRCKQPCRKRYTYDRTGFEEKSYALSLSDLSVGEKIEKLIDAGVLSFKIEGRMRRAEYVAAAVSYYRALLDGKKAEKEYSDLKRTYNRGNYTQGLAFGQDKRFLSPLVQGHMGEKVGVVNVRNGKYYVESNFSPNEKDAFKILRSGKEVGGAVFESRTNRGFCVRANAPLKNGDGVFITTDTNVNERVLSKKRTGVLALSLYFEAGKKAAAQCGDVFVESEDVFSEAQTRPLNEEEIKKCFLKTDGLPIEIQFDIVRIEGNIFAPKSQLNAFRRAVYDAIFAKLTGEGRLINQALAISLPAFSGDNEKTAVMASDFTGLDVDVAIYKPEQYGETPPKSFISGNFEKYVYYAPFMTQKDKESLLFQIRESGADGVYVENYGGIIFAKQNGLKIFAGTGLNLLNPVSVEELLKIDNVAYYAISKEANVKEMKGLISEKAFALSLGDIKVMDLLYCPFSKTCAVCDKKKVYTLTDENNRAFPVRRYLSANGDCRFEVYNCASLIGTGVDGAGKLIDLSVTENKKAVVCAIKDENKQKEIYKNYTSGHYRRGIL